MGRPPAIDLAYADCEFPVDEEETLNDADEIVPGSEHSCPSLLQRKKINNPVKENSKYMFVRDVFYSIIQVTLAAKTPSYESIMDTDRKIREAICDYPYSTETPIDPSQPDYHDATASLRDYCQSQCRSICEPLLLPLLLSIDGLTHREAMLYLHRSFFAEAFMDGLDPAKNPQTQFLLPSCLAAYRASSTIIEGFALQFRRCPEFAIRLWPNLIHVLSASVRLGNSH